MKRNFYLSSVLTVLGAVLLLTFCFPLKLEADVRINEFVASNNEGLKDSHGIAVDWIEIFNDSDSSINIGGYYLTDSKNNLTRWQFPSPTDIAAQGYLIVFADGTLTPPVSGKELHANFSLSKDGEYLALVDRDGTTIIHEFAGNFPVQYSDISYGVSQEILEFVNPETPLQWKVPSQSGPSSSGNGNGGVGFTQIEGGGGFSVSYWALNVESINSVTEAETYIKNQSYWRTDTTYPVMGVYETINFADSSSPGHYTPDNPFPTHASTAVDKNNFVLVIQANIFIPKAGMWTFGSMSDDGFHLRITGNGVNFVCEYPSPRGMADTLASFNFRQPGVYSARMIYYESGGGAGVELYAAEGSYDAWNSTAFRLVGDLDRGGISTAGAIAPFIETDVQDAMKDVNTRIDLEYPFVVEKAPAADTTLTFKIRYTDGFVAMLNGDFIASANNPTALPWNAAATQSRPIEQVLVWDEFPVNTQLLKEGENILKIIGLNHTAQDPEFLIQPSLTLVDNSELYLRYFKTPSPKAANGKGFLGATAPVLFSHPRGYCDAPFVLEMSCTQSDAQIRYTLDGSVPTETTGYAYTAPITIHKTTVLRAFSYKPSHLPSEVNSCSWIFLEDVLTQSSTPPENWPASGQINSHVMYYGMNAGVTASPLYADRIRQGFKDIQTISILTDMDNLFDPQIGIYVNPWNSGASWERPASVELIDPSGGEEFHINAGLRIRGAASRTSGNPKHSFRLFFRSKYGESKLLFPLFGKEGASEFDKVDLRTEQNHSWHREAPSTYTAVREVFSRDTQRDAGTIYSRSRYYHLFLNGLYWGLYMTQERVDSDFAATYMGGEVEDWDTIKTDSSSNRATVAGDGNMEAWQSLYNIMRLGFGAGKEANYYRVRGLNPDGSRNANYPILLDQDNLIKYMINAYYTGDPDNPRSLFINAPNNLFALYNRVNPDGFKWFRHDAEHSLASNRGDWGLTMDYTAAGWGYTDYGQFEPMVLHLALCENEEYRMRFGDIVQEQFFNGGILTPEKCIERYQSRMNEIDLAVIGESARWGGAMGGLRTRDVDWINENNYMLNTYFPQRTAIVLQQFKNRGWFPNIPAPTSTLISGMCDPGQEITLSADSPFYYTLDGSDPRLADGSINPNAILVSGTDEEPVTPTEPQTLIEKKSNWKYFDKGSTPPSQGIINWRSITYNDSAWGEGPGCLGFGSRPDVGTRTTRVTGEGFFVNTTYFRRQFNLDSLDGIMGLKLSLNRDDGAVVYLNGVEILRSNMAEGTVNFSTLAESVVDASTDSVYFDYTLSAQRLRAGANVIAVEIHQCSADSSDMYFDMELSTTVEETPAGGASSTNIRIDRSTLLNMRTYQKGAWSALSQFDYLVRQNYSALRISELMYSPVFEDEGMGNYDDYAWLEICNTSEQSLNMREVQFTEGITYTFPDVEIPAGGYLVLAKSAEHFASRYDTNGMLLVSGYSGNLARKGEQITLQAPDSEIIQSFAYERKWHPDADRTGYSLEVINLAAPLESWSQPYNWYVSPVWSGTPGYAAKLLQASADQVAPLGGSALISLGDVSGEIQNLQWVHFNLKGKWAAIPEVTSAALQLDSLSEDDAGLYMARFELNGETWLSTPSELMILLAQPQNVTTFEGGYGTMSLDVLSVVPGKLQWQKFTSADQWEDILQGSGTSLELNYVTGYDAGAYRVRLSDSWFSDEALLTVETETVPPEITQVDMNTDRYIRVTYSEYVSTETALNKANYQLNGGAQILNAVASGGSTVPGAVLVVLLETTPLAQGSVYALSVSGVCDISFNKNPIAPDTVKYIQTDIMGQGLLRQVWYNCDSSLSTLTGKATYPNSPDLVDSVTSFVSPIDWADNYGQKLSGLIIPPVTGSYTFWICSDDDSELWLSTDESPTHKRRIAYLYGWAPVNTWDNYASQKSSPVSLTANKPYYIEGIQTDGTGGDHIMVRWQLPSGVMESPIPQTRLYPPGSSFTAPEIVIQPKSISRYEGESAAFEVFVKSGTPITYQWEINGVTDNSLNLRTLIFDNVALAQDGLQVRCRVTNLNGQVTSTAAILSVLPPLEEVSILTQPQGGTIREGETVTLSVLAAGSPPLSYEWYRDGNRVEGDAETLVVSEAGIYKVKVANPKGSLFSSEAQVVVQTDPQEPPLLSILRGTSDQVLIQFEGRLEAASSLSEADWVQIATESPVWITPSEKIKFFRAVR